MSATTNHWKLGLFVVVGILTLVASLIWVAASRLERETVESITFFDTDVHGLEVGAPVKFRGVTIGRVAKIGFASDQRHVKVTQTIFVDALRELGLSDQARVPEEGPFVPDDLRVQLESSLLTGVAFLEGDFVDVERYPVPEYPFPVPWNTVHAVPSAFESLEGGLVTVAESMPELASEAVATMRELRTTLESLELAETQKRLNRVLALAEDKLENLERFPLVAQGTKTLEETETAVRELRQLLTELRHEGGPVRSTLADYGQLARTLDTTITESDLPGTAAALRGVVGRVEGGADEVALLVQDLRREIVTVRGTLGAVRALALALERDPSSLLYGRSANSPLSSD